jgi:hypothetical protein
VAVFPAAGTMTTEAELVKHIGGFEYPQLKTRAFILAATGQLELLREVIGVLIEKFDSERTREHFMLLRSRYPEAMRSIEL